MLILSKPVTVRPMSSLLWPLLAVMAGFISPTFHLAISHSPNSGVSAAIPTATATPTLHLVPAMHPLKRCKLDVPARLQCKMTSVRRLEALTEALDTIEKLLKAKKTQFVAGPNGLQAKRTRAIQAR